jgi:formate hydrogenlyase transcriptional activator
MHNADRLVLDNDKDTNEVLRYLVHYPPPISLDELISLTGSSALAVLRIIEQLKARKIITEKSSYGKGFYFLNNQLLSAVDNTRTLTKDFRTVIRKIIAVYSATSRDEQERTIALAGLYLKSGEYAPEGFQYIERAANISVETGHKEAAIQYYDFLSKIFLNHHIAKKDAKFFVNSAIAKISLSSHLVPLQEQILLLMKARVTAIKNDLPEPAARVSISLGHALKAAGRYRDASRYFEAGLRLAKQVDDTKLLKAASITLSDFLFWQGRVAEAIAYYEETIGDVEDFGDDVFTLKGIVMVGWCYVICGRVARGIGLIEAVRSKAQSGQMIEVLIFAELMKAVSLIEIRNITEAEVCLERLLSYPEDTLGHYVLWVTHGCQSYVLFAKGRLEEALDHWQKSYQHSRIFGWTHHRGPWNFEILYALEAKGYRVGKITYDSEIERMLKWDDIYMRGVALRYRAIKDIRNDSNTPRILRDLKMSERYLRKSGAQIEMARTHLTLGRYYLEQGQKKRGQAYLERACEFFSKLDKKLFPEELMAFLPQGQRTEVIMERMTSIGETLGVIQDRSLFLDKMINLAMDVTMATRGSFFVIDEKKEVIPTASRNLDPASLNRGFLEKIKPKILEANWKGDEVVFLDAAKDSSLSSEIGTNALICAPVGLGKELYGYLYLDSLLSDSLSASLFLSYVRFLSNQIAIGLSNLASREEVRALKERQENEALFYEKEFGVNGHSKGIIAQSESMKKVMAQVEQVAGTDSTVLITGETGVGKDLIAKAVHNLSSRCHGPFIHVNLTAIPHQLVSSELFGHEKGAFTGAIDKYRGRFELAHGGTIFLDEIGDLPDIVQLKLLRVLQEGVFERLGSGKPISSNFRVIAATNRDLSHEIEKGTFRQDLYYRLSVFPIHISPLRERKEDIPPLVVHFSQKFGKEMGKEIKYIPRNGLDKFLLYHWPGNVRELEHFIERAVILTDRNSYTLRLPEIPLAFSQAATTEHFLPLAEVEKDYVEKVLLATRWKVSGSGGAALILGLNPKTLFSRMQKLKISKPKMDPIVKSSA